jgi:hypothetical protein
MIVHGAHRGSSKSRGITGSGTKAFMTVVLVPRAWGWVSLPASSDRRSRVRRPRAETDHDCGEDQCLGWVADRGLASSTHDGQRARPLEIKNSRSPVAQHDEVEQHPGEASLQHQMGATPTNVFCRWTPTCTRTLHSLRRRPERARTKCALTALTTEFVHTYQPADRSSARA